MKTAKRPALNAWRRACLQVLAIVARCPACRAAHITIGKAVTGTHPPTVDQPVERPSADS